MREISWFGRPSKILPTQEVCPTKAQSQRLFASSDEYISGCWEKTKVEKKAVTQLRATRKGIRVGNASPTDRRWLNHWHHLRRGNRRSRPV